MKDKIKALLKNKSFLIGAASFMLPALVLYVIFAINKVHPFGDKQIIVTDFWHQYYPFLCVLQENLKTGGSLLYEDTIGMGINFLSLIAYYCASPLNILTVFVSKANLRDLVTVIVVMKVGLSGLFFSVYLKKLFGKYDISTVVFSALYALSGYMLGYYWNIMWLDTVYMLPLVMLGVHLLVKENKIVLYIISLALAVIFNFYIGFMVCIFTAIYFFAECIKESMNLKAFLKKLMLIAFSSVIALAITAFITIPAYNSLGNTVSQVPKSTAEKSVGERIKASVEELGEDLDDVVGRLASFNEPVPKEGLPNIYSGIVSVVMLGFFLASAKVSKREKIATMLTVGILLLSLVVSELDIIWHGFHKPNMVPYRYAFIMSFVLVAMAYRTYLTLFDNDTDNKKNTKIGTLAAVLISVLVSVCAVGEAKLVTVILSVALALVYVVVVQSYLNEKKNKDGWKRVFCGLIVIEVIANTAIAVPVVRTTTYSSYYYRGEEIEQVLENVDAKSSLGRVENANEYILNDGSLYGFKGVSAFTSTANYALTKLMEKLAICAPARANRYYYQTTSPLTNSFLSVERVIFRNNMDNLNPYLELESSAADEEGKNEVSIYKNTQYLPLGFMTDSSLKEGIEGYNPFEVQNDLFRKATGIDETLFTKIDITSVPASNTIRVYGSSGKYEISFHEGETEKNLSINYVTPDANPIFAYIDCVCADKVVVNNTDYKAVKRKYIFPAGEYPEGTKVTFKFHLNGDFPKKDDLIFHVYSMNAELFERGMEKLRDEALEIIEYEETRIKANISVKEDGLLYTSLPYEKGWTLYVDGKETEITPFEGAMIAAELKKGEHEIVLKYSPDGFKLGTAISIVAILAFAVIIVFTRRKKNG